MKKNTKKLKQILVASTLLLGMLTISGNTSKATLQANSTTHATGKTATGASWIQSIREMEKSGQTMGLTETIGTDLVATSESNNIDVHMMKTTEYGAMAILSASGFGYSGKLQDAPVKSTTGNVTGVYAGNSWEWTAGVCSASTVGKDARYYDLYTINDRTSAKVGDALGLDTYTSNPGCSGWYGSSVGWISNTSYGITRGSNGIFSIISNNNTVWANSSNYCCGRGVAVVKEGI